EQGPPMAQHTSAIGSDSFGAAARRGIPAPDSIWLTTSGIDRAEQDIAVEEAGKPGSEAGREQHLVSFLIPVQNEAQYVREALTSVLGQTHRNLEVIVIDDHSTDDTCAIVEEMCRNDPRLHLHRSDGHGKVHAFNM